MKKEGTDMAKDRKTDFVKHPHARSYPMIHVAPQCRPVKPGRRRGGLQRVYSSQDGKKHLSIELWRELDIADQDVLLAILAIARSPTRAILIGKDTRFVELRKDLALAHMAEDMDALKIEVKRYELLTEIGRSTGSSNYKWLMESLTRLKNVGFTYRVEKHIWGFNLLSYSLDIETDILRICINPISARAITADKWGYVMQNREERHSLKTDTAKGLHAVLCGLVRTKKTKVFTLDSIADRVWARYTDKIDDEDVWNRRRDLKSAAVEISGLDRWSVVVEGRGESAKMTVIRR